MATDSSKLTSDESPLPPDTPASHSPKGTDPDSPQAGQDGAGGDVQATGQPADAESDSEATSDEHASQGRTRRLWPRGSFLLVTAIPSWLTSMVVHVIALLILALITVPSQPDRLYNELTVGKAETPRDDLDEFLDQAIEPLDVEPLTADEFSPAVDTEVITEEPVLSPADDLEAAPLQMEFDPLGTEAAPRTGLISKIGAITGTGLEGRGTAARKRLVREGGGTKASEAAVASALKWFAAHQNSDGSWNLDHRFGPCQNRCRNPGTRRDAPNGATALALLPFLGAGQTHMEGEYKETVGAGLQYLLQNMKIVGQRASLFDEGGNYYSHGIGTIVLCEAYAMTKDRNLMKPAQMAIYETAYAQDPVSGGWRYRAQQRGDTSALGWQLMALKSAHMAYLHVPPQTHQLASRFLDSVQTESGAKYGYLDPGEGSATTAVGLLCRMYLGWKRDNPALERGVEFLKRRGPSEDDMYYNYYGTQVMRHFGGDAWKVWNEAMREYLVKSQSQTGHEKGSWFFSGGGHSGAVGGRLYCTSMAAMILEVYYRHLPIYKKQASEEDFPL